MISPRAANCPAEVRLVMDISDAGKAPSPTFLAAMPNVKETARYPMAVGGVNAENAQEFIKCGCPYLGVGSGMFRRADVSRGDAKRLRADVEAFEMAVRLPSVEGRG